ncbi:MAG: MBL fold metallo-hydrolase [Clostridia bacterium]|nr:MBL fold metallo-hydrolase [Clostridia bacterium]
MELHVLGCWAPYPIPGGACSGYLVGDGKSFLLLDCGHGVAAKLLGAVPLEAVTAVLLSHLHPDHWHDLPALRHALRSRAGHRLGRHVVAPLPLYVPGEPRELFTQISSYQEVFAVQAIEELSPVCGGKAGGEGDFTAHLGAARVCFYRTRHVLPAYCLEVVLGASRLIYTGDTAWWDGLADLAAGADLLLAEASLLNVDRPLLPGDHLTAAEAGRLAREAGVKRLVLTHFWPEYDLEELRREAQTEFGGEVILAREGEVYRF